MDLAAIRTATSIALAAALPVFELYVARSVYLQRGDLYNDSGFTIALGMVFFALCVLFHRLSDLRFRPRQLLLNLTLLLLALGARRPIAEIGGPLVEIEWIGALWIAMLASALCVFSPAARTLQHFRANQPILGFLGVVYLMQTLYYLMRHVYWFNRAIWYDFFAPKLTGVVQYLLEVMQYEILASGQPHVIKHPFITLYIFSPCSGLEGVVFFCAAFSAMMMLDYRSIPMWKIIRGFILGTLMILLLNILRITVFFMFGVWAITQWGYSDGVQATIDLFHANIGWLLYGAGMVGFFMWFYRDLDKQQPTHNAG